MLNAILVKHNEMKHTRNTANLHKKTWPLQVKMMEEQNLDVCRVSHRLIFVDF